MGKQKRLEARRRAAGKRYRTRAIGPDIRQATPAEVFAAMARLPDDLDWRTMAPNVLPIFPRRRPMPFDAGEPVRVLLPPGVLTGFGIDIGPAVLHISGSLLDSWGIQPAELAERALANLRERAGLADSRDVVVQAVTDVPVRALQSGAGWASTLVLLPDELTRIFGAWPQCFVAPMRDVLLSLPVETDRELVAWLADEFSSIDPNGLSLEAFVLRDGDLRCEALDPVAARA